MDLSSYSETSPFFMANLDRKEVLLAHQKANKGVVGLMKNELSGDREMQHCIALRPKLYAFSIYSTSKEHLTCKGISRYVIQDQLNLKLYKSVLETHLPTRHSMNLIRSKKHQLYIERITKTSLSLFDDKRYWVTKYFSLPHGHPLIATLNNA